MSSTAADKFIQRRSDDASGKSLIRIKVPGLSENIGEVRKAVSNVLEGLPLSDCERADVLLAFGEACNNAVTHGSGLQGSTLEVTCRVNTAEYGSQARRLQIDVKNSGNGFHPERNAALFSMPSADELTDHGRGLPLMRMLMDDIQVLSVDGNTIVRLTKSLP